MLRWENYVQRDARKAGEEEDWKKKTRDRGGWKRISDEAVKKFLTRFNKIAIQGTPQMAVDKEAISLSRVYLNTILSVPAVILCVTRLN